MGVTHSAHRGPDWALWQGDALDVLRTWPDNLADCCVTSPPYWGLRDYGAEGQLGLEATWPEYVDKLVTILEEVRRILKPDGALWLNLGDCFVANAGKTRRSPSGNLGEQWGTRSPRENPSRLPQPGLKPKDLVGLPWRVAFALQDAGWWLRSDVVWAKPAPMPESVRDRPTRSHEYIFLLTKSEIYFYNSILAKEPAVSTKPSGNGFRRPERESFRTGNYVTGTDERWNPWATASEPTNGTAHSRGKGTHPRSATATDGVKQNPSFSAAVTEPVAQRNWRDVWTIPNERHGKDHSHYATFPEEIPRRGIIATSCPGGLVIDPFCGTATTGAAALKLGRQFAGIDISAEYLDYAARRLQETEHAEAQDPRHLPR